MFLPSCLPVPSHWLIKFYHLKPQLARLFCHIGSYVWVWIRQGFYLGCSSESDICSSFILYFPWLDVLLLICWVREMLADSQWYPHLTN